MNATTGIHAGLAFLVAIVCAQFTIARDEGPRTILEDRPTILKPKVERTEAEEDVLISSAHFGKARILLQRGEYPGALRHFQRAWRYNPSRTSLLRRIVPLASQLKRTDVAARYAVITAEQDSESPLLIQMGGLLMNQGDFERAAGLFERALRSIDSEETSLESVSIRVELGRLYYLTKDYEKAANAFATVLEALNDPDALAREQRDDVLANAELLYSLMAESFLETGRPEAAEEAFQKADAIKPNKGLHAYNLARIEAKKPDYNAARKQLDVYFDSQLSVVGTAPYELLSRILSQGATDNPAPTGELIEELKRLRDKDPSNAPLGYYLADRLYAKGELEEAERLFLELLELQPAVEAYEGLTSIYVDRKQVDKLVGILGQVVQRVDSLDPVSAEVDELVKDDALVAELIKHVKSHGSDNSSALEWPVAAAAALVAISAKQFEPGMELAQLAVERAKEEERARILERLGLAAFLAERSDDAAELFQQAIDTKPDDETAAALNYFLAGALEFAGKTDEALGAAEAAVRLDAESPQFHGRNAWIHYHAKRYDAAERAYAELLGEFDGDNETPGARDSVREARLILSNICVIRERIPEAEEWLELILDEFPEDTGAMNDLGYLWVDQGKHLNRALAMVQKAVAAEPENSAYLDSLGWAYYRLERYSDAVRELEKATANGDPDAVILEHLADAYLAVGKKDEAVANWIRAIELLADGNDEKKRSRMEEKLKKHRSR